MMATLNAAIGASPLPPLQHQQFYPAAEATHAEVLADRSSFDRTLKRVQLHFGIDEKAPRLGGRDLDLQQLYANVTNLGGCAQVIANKQWREAAASFHYPETITSVSYTLRRAYINLLWDFEQVYFFRVTGPRVPPPANSSPANGAVKQDGAPDQAAQQNGSGGGSAAAGAGQAAAKPGRKKRKAAAPSADVVATSFPACPESAPLQLTAACSTGGTPEADAVGGRGIVTVDARFDAGYLVSVALGQRLFRGMLYYPPPEPAEALRGEPVMAGGAQPMWAGSEPDRKASARAVSTVPKPNRTPFNFFSAAMRDRMRAQHPQLSLSEAMRKVAELWQRMSSEERSPYGAMSIADKDRYHCELEAYNYQLAAQQSQLSADAAAERVRAAQVAAAALQQQQQEQAQQQQVQQQHAQPQRDGAPEPYPYPAAASVPQQQHQLGMQMQMHAAAAAAAAAAQQHQQQQQPGGMAQHMHQHAGQLLQQMGMAAPPNLAQHMGMSGQATRLIPPAALQFQSGPMGMHGGGMGQGGMGSHQQ